MLGGSQVFPHSTPHTPVGWVQAPIFLGVPHPKSPGFSTPRHGVVSGWFPWAVNSFSVTHDKFRDEVRAGPEPGVQAEKGTVYLALGSCSSELAFAPKSAFGGPGVNLTTSFSMSWLKPSRRGVLATN